MRVNNVHPDLFDQVKSTILVTTWVFIGILEQVFFNSSSDYGIHLFYTPHEAKMSQYHILPHTYTVHSIIYREVGMFRNILIILLGVIFSANVMSAIKPINDNLNLKPQQSRDYVNASGDDIAGYLNEDYNNTVINCGKESEPAFLCSGVMIRAALPGTGYHIWDPSPSAETTGGISFSYLRVDDNSLQLVHNESSGFIFYPYFYAPDGKDTNIDIMCSFPTDADTVNRSDNGCGQHSGDYPNSGPCQDQGITTAQGWYDNGTSMDGECGFDVDDDSPYDTADAFMQSIQARSLLTDQQRNEQDEIRLKTWAMGMQDTLPVEAFWYIKGDAQGLSDAQYNQQDFYDSTTDHLVIPVITVIAPSDSSGTFAFEYNDADQVVTK